MGRGVGGGGCIEPTFPSRLVASHFDVDNDIRFVMAAIFYIHLQG